MNQSNPFQMIPFPWPAPQQQQKQDQEAPARVLVALSYLRNVTMKQTALVAVNDISIEWRDGQELETAEKLARDAACHLLVDYLRGGLKKSVYEKSEKSGPGWPKDKAGFLMKCPHCFPNGFIKPNCNICGGVGEGMTFKVDRSGE